MIITREKGMRMWGGGSGSTSASGVNGGGDFSLAVEEGEGTGNAYTDFTYESGTLTLNKATEFVTVDFFNKLFTAYDANGNVIAPNNTTPTLDNIKFKAGAWTEQYLSALGQNSSGGGGGGGIELSDVWQSLKTNTDDYQNQKINIAHIPDLSGTYATKTWVNQQGFVTSSGVTSVAMTVPTGLSVSGTPITSTGTLALTFATGYSIPTTAKQSNWDTAYGWGNHATAGYALASDVYSSSASRTKNYVLAAPSTANGAATFRKLVSSDIPDLSATYATASRATTLEGYFTDGVAKTAAKLNTGTTTYTAWGQTYWSSGVPQSISGNMTSVGSITPSANGNALGTTSARFNIYGTSGNFSGNVSISGTLSVTGATTLTGLLTANGGIVVPSSKTIKIGDCTISWDSTNSMLKFDTGIYSTGAVSALGSNSSGGGSGGIDIEAMWAELQGNTGTYANAKINVNHIPDISSTYGYAKQSWVNTQLGNYVTLNTAQTISGLKTMTHGLVVSGRVYSSGDDEGIIVKPAANGFAGITLGEPSGIHTTLYLDSSKVARWVYLSSDDGTRSSILHPNKNGVIALTSDIPTSLDGIPDGSTRKLSNYLPLTGGTLTGSLTVNSSVTALGYNAKFDVDTSREMGIGWLNTSGTRVASVTYHNTAQNIIINPIGSSDTWSDAVGKYSLIVGNNKLTYNTYPILHSNNYSSYALPLSGGTMTGILKWKDTNALPETTSPTYMLTIDSFANGGTTKWANLTNVTVGKATTASLLSYSHTNEINFKGGMQVNCWFNFRNADTNSEDGGTTAINYRFCNYTRETDYSTVYAGTFVGAFSGNATTATTLATSRTIWGQSFNGSANVSGNLSDVGNITATYYTLSDTAANPYLKLVHTYNSTNYNYYIQAYTGLLYLGAGSANSMAINSTGQVSLVGHLRLSGAQASSSTGNTTQIIFRTSAGVEQVAISSNSSALIINPTSSTTTKQIILGVGSVASTFGNSITCNGEVTASSDGRKKNIISNTKFNVKDIASARSVLFEWNDGRDDDMEKKIHGGSIAQDWLGKADSFLSQDEDGFYSINYGALALCSAITIAREVVKHEDRITLLEKENARLKARVAELEERRA